MRPQVLSQDLSISHDFLDQDSQVFHALAKKSSTRVRSKKHDPVKPGPQEI
jgi:hypothetical protein